MSQLFSEQNRLSKNLRPVGVDIETTPIIHLGVEKIWSIAYHGSDLSGVVHWQEGITIDALANLLKNAEYNYRIAPSETTKALWELRSVLCCEDGMVPCFHNAQFDKRIFQKAIYIPFYHCTMQLAYCLMPPSMLGSTGEDDGLWFYSLSNLAKLGLCEAKVDFKSDWQQFSFEMPEYNKQDAKSCYQLAVNILNSIDEQTFSAYVIDMCAMEMVVNFNGCTVDSDVLSDVFLDKEEQLRKVEERLSSLVPAVCTGKTKKLTNRPVNTTNIKRGIYSASDAGKYVILQQKAFSYEVMQVERFNPNSDDHVRIALKFKCGWEPSDYNKKSGKAKVDKATLKPLAEKWELADLILKHRKLRKLLSTYLRPYKETDEWNKLWPSFPLCATRTGRLASRSPNFQNVPADDTRKLIVAPENYDLVCIDLSQIELRILAWYLYVVMGQHDSSASYLWDAYHARQDVHAKNQEMMGLSDREDGRKLAKIGTFLYIYGGREHRLMKSLGISMQEAKYIVQNLESNARALPALRNYFLGLAKSNPFLRTYYNHKVTYPKIHSKNKYEVLEAERQYFNALIQGTQADIIKILMWQSRRLLERYGAMMLVQVHDELVFECPKGNTKSFCEGLMKLFNNEELLPGLPIEGIPGVGSNWHDAKKDGSRREDEYKEAIKAARKYEFDLA